ncbi:hypothetical protein PQX77_000994 [Marasmius sp. AFHP31]|nr:hypothetical protein PQX77_000994 [Marasmius sp. AFHP31]
MASETTSTLTISNRFDLPASDITLQSSDRVLYKIHRINLEMNSKVFADAGTSTVGAAENEVVLLSESSEVLEVMLQYLYLQPQPDLRKVEFGVMKEVAEAVEKYEIYCAVGVCCHQMRLFSAY